MTLNGLRTSKDLLVKMFEAIKLEKDEQTLSDFKHFLFFSIKVVQSFFTRPVIVSLNVQFTCTDNKLK